MWCYTIVEGRSTDSVAKAILNYSSNPSCIDCTAVVFVVAEQPYVLTEHIIGEVVVRQLGIHDFWVDRPQAPGIVHIAL